MNPYNFISIQGRLTADPELRQTTTGKSTCRFNVAVNRPYQKDKQQEADFITVSVWNQTAEFVSRYFKKGSPICVVGSMRNNNYTDNNGVKHYAMELLADNVAFVTGSKNNNENNSASPTKSVASQSKSTNNTAADIGGLDEFEEIIGDGEVPF